MDHQNHGNWMIFGLATFFLFGLTNFCLGVIAENSPQPMQASFSAPLLLWSGMGLLGLAAGLQRRMPVPRELWKRSLPILAGITLAAGMMSLKSAFAVMPSAKGALVAVTAANALIVALFSLFFLGEKLHPRHWLGLALIVSGIAVLGGAPGRITPIAMGLGLLTMMLFGITNFLLKLAAHVGWQPLNAVKRLWLTVGLCGLLGLVFVFSSGRGLAGLPSWSLRTAALATGLTLGLGMFSLKIAVSRGKAGPATAVAGANAVLVTVLDALFYAHFPAPASLLGISLALAGMIILVSRR